MNMIRTAFLLAFMTALFMGVGTLLGGKTGMLIAMVIAIATNFYSYWKSDQMVLRMHRGVEVGPDTAPEYYEIVARLAEEAQLPMPRVYVIDTPQPNAFATGRDPEHAAVAASKGLLERLSPEEIAGVMAHELAHIAHRDTLTMTITASIAGAISMLGNFAMFFRGGRDNRAGLIGTLAAMFIAPFAAMLVQMAISRTREYAADKRGAEICGNPDWLADALQQIANIAPKIPNQLAEQSPGTAHMFIFNPLGHRTGDGLFSTHPNVENRIALLRQMADEWAIEDDNYQPDYETEERLEPEPEPDQVAPRHNKQPTKTSSAKPKWGRQEKSTKNNPWN